MVDEHPEMIKSQMEDTRAQLAEKLEALGQQVTASVASATNVVADTVESVKEVVDSTTETVQATVETVTNPLDIRGQMEKNPWLVMGGAVLTGFVVGKLLSPRSHATAYHQPVSAPASQPQQTMTTSAQPREESKPRRESQKQQQGSLFGLLEKPMAMVQGMAMGSLFSVLRGVIANNVPADWQQQALGLVEDMGKQLGATMFDDFGGGGQQHQGHDDQGQGSQPQKQHETGAKPTSTRSRKRETTHGKRNGSSRPEVMMTDR